MYDCSSFLKCSPRQLHGQLEALAWRCIHEASWSARSSSLHAWNQAIGIRKDGQSYFKNREKLNLARSIPDDRIWTPKAAEGLNTPRLRCDVSFKINILVIIRIDKIGWANTACWSHCHCRRSITAVIATHLSNEVALEHHDAVHVASASFSAELSVSSPRKLFIFIT